MSSSVFPVPLSGIQESIIAAKGDLIVGTANDTPSILSVASTAGYLLSVDSAETTGLKWAAPAASGSMTQLASGSFSGSSLALTSISGSYKNLVLQISELSVNSVSGAFALTFMGLSSDYRYATRGTYGTTTNAFTEGNMSAADIPLRFVDNLDTGNNNSLNIIFYDYAASTIKLGEFVGMVDCRFTQPTIAMGAFGNTNASARAALTSITVTVSTTFDGGTYKLFGVN